MYPPPNPPFYRRAPLRVGAPTPTTPRRSPPALKRRGLRGASQHRPLYSFLGACATCRPLACRLAWAGEAPYHSPGQNVRVKCTAPPLFLWGGAALAFCPCLLRQGAHPEGTGPLPWPVGPWVPAGTGPTFNGCCPLLPCWEPHCSTASRVCARRSRPATHPAGGHIRKPPLLLLLPRSAEPGPLFCVGPALDCAVLLRHCPTWQKGAQHHVYHR